MHHPLLILSVLSPLITFMAGMYARRSLSSEMKILLLYFSLASLAEFTSAYLALNKINNLWLLHVFTIIEYGFFIAIFSSWQKNTMLKRILRISIPIFTLMGFLSILFLENLHQVNNFSKPVASLILVAVSAYTLFSVNMECSGSVLREPRFWVGFATLLYFTGTLILFALSNVLLTFSIETAQKVFLINVILGITANFLYMKGFLCQSQKSGGL